MTPHEPEAVRTAIRPAVPDDAPALAEIHSASFRAIYAAYPTTLGAADPAGRESYWRLRLDGDATQTLLATRNEAPVGFVEVGPSPDREAGPPVGQIRSIHVAPDRTGAGIGRSLMRAAERLLVEHGFAQATLWVVADNERARSFYSRLGWRTDGRRRWEVLSVGSEDGDRVEVVRYHKDLDGSETPHDRH